MRILRRRSLMLVAILLVIGGLVITQGLLRPLPPEIVWTRQLGKTGDVTWGTIALDGAGHVWIGGAAIESRAGAGTSIGFLARCSSNGSLQQMKRVGRWISRFRPVPSPGSGAYVIDHSEDVCLVSREGKVLWRKKLFSSHAWYAEGIAAHQRSAVYVACNTWDRAIDEPVVVRMDTAGRVVWTRMLGSKLGATAAFAPKVTAAETDQHGNCIVVGYRDTSGFVLVLDPSGRMLWQVRCPAYLQAVRVDDSGIYVGGAVDGPPEESTFARALTFLHLRQRPRNSAPSRTHLRAVKYDLRGRELWSRRLDTSNGQSMILALDRDGDLYGLASGCSAVDGMPLPSLLAKWNASGNTIWTRELPGFSSNTSICVDRHGSIYVCGDTRPCRSLSQLFAGMTLIKLRQR